jgi:hypothetical protein
MRNHIGVHDGNTQLCELSGGFAFAGTDAASKCNNIHMLIFIEQNYGR